MDYTELPSNASPDLLPVGDQATVQALPVLEPTPPMQPMDFNQNDLAEIELSRQIAFGLEKKDRLSQAKTEAQYPAIQRSLDESHRRAESVLSELRTARQALTQAPPQLVQGQMGLGDLLATAAGALFGGRADRVVAEGMQQSDKRNQLAYQNQLSQYNLNREQAAQLVDFLQRQYLGEDQHSGQLEDLQIRTQIDDQQTQRARDWQAGESDKQRTFQEREKAWQQLYSANSDGEVLAAAQRLQSLDPEHAPDQSVVDKAVASARTRREGAALDYFKATVQRTIDAYQGVVPDSVRVDLEQRIRAIAQQFDVDPKLFGEIPTAAFWKRQLDERELQAKKDQWSDRLKFMTDKERNDLLVDWARIEVQRKQAAISQQNADTTSARLAWDKVKQDTDKLGKKIDGQRQTKVVRLRGIEKQLKYLKDTYGSDVRNPKTGQMERMVRFDKRKEYERLQMDWQQTTGEIQQLDEALGQIHSQAAEAQDATKPPRTYTTQYGGKFVIGGG